jgi:chromosome segregation protein
VIGLGSIGARVAELESEIGLIEDSVSQYEGQISELVLGLEELKKKGHEEALAQLSLQKERDNLKKEGERLAREEERARQAEERLATLVKEEETEAQEIAVFEKRLEDFTLGLDAERKAYEGMTASFQGLEATLKELRKEHDLARSHTGDLRVTLSRLEGDMKHLEQQIREKYDLNLSETAPSYRETEIDRPVEEQRLAELKNRLEKMSDVNLGSISEYEELKNREQFLGRQVQDLEQALEGLKKAIVKIDETTKVRFEETFVKVNERFQALFPRLFGGGRAELRLTEETPHQVGVDLFVQPPGKKLAHIGLLSGGEKAMSAVAFVFSLFLIKPSPFCILDEVDAPLDDANVGRFHRLLQEMLARSQFILITHNRRTMENCHLLYGVTMEEPGISKIVSVRLAERLPLAS